MNIHPGDQFFDKKLAELMDSHHAEIILLEKEHEAEVLELQFEIHEIKSNFGALMQELADIHGEEVAEVQKKCRDNEKAYETTQTANDQLWANLEESVMEVARLQLIVRALKLKNESLKNRNESNLRRSKINLSRLEKEISDIEKKKMV